MKKIIYITLLTLSIAFTIISCTEEEVTPSSDSGGGGGSTGQIK